MPLQVFDLIGVAVFATGGGRVRVARIPWPTLDVADALGLAMFSVTGTRIAEAAGMPAIACVLLGTVTGAAGGVVRDVLTAQVPAVLREGRLYASATIAGMVVVAALRLAALRWELTLPDFELRESGTHRIPE
ncbi:MAG TPA: TRIC cation channel family protein [Gemmatimonadaceae bacterium]